MVMLLALGCLRGVDVLKRALLTFVYYVQQWGLATAQEWLDRPLCPILV